MGMHCVRAGVGRPLLLLHGLGGSWRTWCPALPALRRERDVIAVDLPGFGDSLPLAGPTSVTTLADAVTEFLGQQHLFGVDVAGVDLGGRVALELAARGVVGETVVFSPPGFGAGALRPVARVAWLTQRAPSLVRAIAGNRMLATLLFQGYSARLGAVPRQVLREQLEDYGRARRFWEVLRSLRRSHDSGEVVARRVIVGWGRQDRICRPSEAEELRRRFPKAEVAWVDQCGHLPQWDQPEETVQVILRATERAAAEATALG